MLGKWEISFDSLGREKEKIMRASYIDRRGLTTKREKINKEWSLMIHLAYLPLISQMVAIIIYQHFRTSIPNSQDQTN